VADLLDRFRDHVSERGLLTGRVLVGYSGGADSTCLVHLMSRAGLDFVAGHLHHGQRPEADKEAALCEAFCQELDIPFLVGKADVPRLAADKGIGLEEAGRNARYAFFRQAAARLACSLTATGHTRDDHLETILFNLARGTGTRGLGGIRERTANLVRPLLPFTRAETRAYCESHGLWFHDDPSNFDIDLSRARIRLRILPEFRSLNERADEHLLRTAALADEEDRYLNGVAAAMLEQSEVSLNGDLAFLTRDCEIAFERSRFEQLPTVPLRRALRLAAQALGADLDFIQTHRLVDLLASQENGSITCEGGAIAIAIEDRLVHFGQVQPVEPYRYPLTVPGETASDEFGWEFQAFPTNAPEKLERRGLTTFIDPTKAKGALHFRTLQPGDEITPLGYDHRRKLSDLLSEAKLTKAARSRLPIVCDMVGPIWAPGVCVSEKVRPEPGQSALCLRFGPISAPMAT